LPNGLGNWSNKVDPLAVSVLIVVKIVVEVHPVAATFPARVRPMMEAKRDVKWNEKSLIKKNNPN
jgi:hypothetical protein